MSSEIVIDDSSISEFPEEIEKEINKFPKNLKKEEETNSFGRFLKNLAETIRKI